MKNENVSAALRVRAAASRLRISCCMRVARSRQKRRRRHIIEGEKRRASGGMAGENIGSEEKRRGVIKACEMVAIKLVAISAKINKQ
jgi:hypothetical protein